MSTQPILPLPLAPDPLIGQRLGDFVVEQPMAAGGMGVVYRARHPLIGRLAAIKVLKPEFAADLNQTDRFLKEAQALSAIKHRGIVEIYGFGDTADGRQYMATEFLDGESLEAVILREAPMPPMRVLSLIDEVLHALSAAHKSSVVHRDLKPSNVFLATQSTGERIVKLLDFGLAKQSPVTLADVAQGPLDKASLVAGTPEYIAPEQARGMVATPRTDLYCLGVMMFEMLSGTLPFKADSIVEMLKKHVYEAPPLLSGRVSNLPDALYDLVGQLLEKDPERRPASAEIVRQTVQRLNRQLQQESTVQRPNPLINVVPAPFRMAGPDAPTPPLDKRNIQTEPVLRTPTADKLETQLLAQGSRRRPYFYVAGAAIVLLLLFLLWPRGTGTGDTVTPPVAPVPKPQVAETKPVEPVEPAPTPAPVEPLAVEPAPTDDDSLPGLPGRPREPKVRTGKPVPAPVEKVEAPAEAPKCVVDSDWRRRENSRLETVYGDAVAAAKDVAQADRVRNELRAWTNKVDDLAMGADCSAVQADIERWAARELKK